MSRRAHAARGRGGKRGQTRPRQRPQPAARTSAPRRSARAGHAVAEEHLHPRDRGPVQAWLRDAVDRRRHLAGLFLPALGITVISAFSQPSTLQRWALVAGVALLVAIAIEAVVRGIVLARAARAEFPDTQVSAARTGWSTFVRAHRTRALRRPPPRVAPRPGRLV
jgi:Protein of unknown function (DUF3043)